MNRERDEDIQRSRCLLENPYAYLDGEGRYDAIPKVHAASVHEVRRVLENQYAYLDEHGGYTEWERHEHPLSSSRPYIDPLRLLGNRAREETFSKRDIEVIARKLQIEMWRRRASIWPNHQDLKPIQVLDPAAALRSIGYAVELEETLGQCSEDKEFFEIAGMIDRSRARVSISRRFGTDIRTFTTAHELGHAILHAGSGLHRDRAVDGAAGSRPRDPIEVEADTFAAYFLLPEKPVRVAFEDVFLTARFVLNEDTAFALTRKSLDAIQNRCRTLRDLTRILAGAEYYNSDYFNSLAKQFGVSVETMAIRLEELDLVER